MWQSRAIVHYYLCAYQTKVTEAREALTEVTKHNTERLRNLNSLLSQKKALDDQLNSQQRKTVFFSFIIHISSLYLFSFFTWIKHISDIIWFTIWISKNLLQFIHKLSSSSSTCSCEFICRSQAFKMCVFV